MKTNKIAYGVYNQQDRINNSYLYRKAKGATLFYLERINSKLLLKKLDPIKIICGDEIHNILQEALDAGYDYCVMQAAGCQIKNLSFHYDILEFIKDNDFGVAGHPLWKTDGRWLELHHQFFIVNLKAWKDVGCPEYGIWERDERMLPVIERSEENFHDDYTPLWVKATGKHAMQPGACQGWKLMSAMFDGGYTVSTLSEKMRLSKFYIYPDHEPEKFEESLRTLTPYPGQNWNQNKWIEDCKFVKDQIWLFNSEYMEIPNQGIYDLAVSTASGFKIFDLFRQPRLTDSAKIIIYDFNPKSLGWYEHFYKWHNEDILECIRAFPDRDHFTWVGQWDPTFIENQGFKDGLSTVYNYYGEENFKEYWRKFKSMPVEFHQVDLYNSPEVLADLMTGPGKKFVNLTNIFSTDATQVIFGHAECIAAQGRCLGYLYTVDPTIDVTLYNYWNHHRWGQVRTLL
ncbi:hypothetical protein UFOVP181_226 [uncultured Caudovirales phage]|uniref:Uncharacterized protein n=1 Tax=uncultured Caudovirales phage TaxID=2100421 RepID=A0A6J7WH01_9CAUD|nr:hypothetical protein UFOVP57_413 [uncultured Caudovirales phage]CAB5208873.1 hypothetical protein UFOVP181_226 [uncultured Caudovirales phage]